MKLRFAVPRSARSCHSLSVVYKYSTVHVRSVRTAILHITPYAAKYSITYYVVIRRALWTGPGNRRPSKVATRDAHALRSLVHLMVRATKADRRSGTTAGTAQGRPHRSARLVLGTAHPLRTTSSVTSSIVPDAASSSVRQSPSSSCDDVC